MAVFALYVRGEEVGVTSGPTEDDALEFTVKTYLEQNDQLKPEHRVYREHIKLIPMSEDYQVAH